MPLINNVLIPELSETPDTLDLLDRSAFVDQIVSISNTLSEHHKNACFAITGEWGIGKSFVLDLYENQIRNIQTSSTTMGRYLLFHYNCWQYDYYDEPLKAIVAAMLDDIDKNVHLLNERTRIALKETLHNVGEGLFNVTSTLIFAQTGFSLRRVRKDINELKNAVQKEIEQQHAFDPHFGFKTIISNLRKEIVSLAKDQTIVFVVDELDRCLPEYAIKVLERLHHLFDGIPNVQVVLAVDKDQLEHTIQQIYGPAVSIPKYLGKYIHFEVNLPTGEADNVVKEMYPQYYGLFSNSTTPSSDVDDFCTTLLKGIDIRTCKAIVEKSYLCHRLLNNDEKLDASFLCVELFLTLLKTYGLNTVTAKNGFNLRSLFTTSNQFSSTTKNLTGLVVLSTKYKPGPSGNSPYYNEDIGRTYIKTSDIWGLILACYRIIIGFTNDSWYNDAYRSFPLEDYMRRYWKFLKSIH